MRYRPLNALQRVVPFALSRGCVICFARWKRGKHSKHSKVKRRYFALIGSSLQYWAEHEDFEKKPQEPKYKRDINGMKVTKSYTEVTRHGTRFVWEIGDASGLLPSPGKEHSSDSSPPTTPSTPTSPAPPTCKPEFILAHDTAHGKARWIHKMFPGVDVEPRYEDACIAFKFAIDFVDGIPKGQERRRNRRVEYEKKRAFATFHRDYIYICKLLADPYLNYCVLPQCESWMGLFGIFDLRRQGQMRVTQIRQGLETCCTPDIGLMENSGMVERVMLSVRCETMLVHLNDGIISMSKRFKTTLLENEGAVSWCKAGGELEGQSRSVSAFDILTVRQMLVEKQLRRLGELAKSTRNALALEARLYRMRHAMQEVISMIQRKLKASSLHVSPMGSKLRAYIKALRTHVIIVSGNILEDMARVVDEFNAECLRSQMSLGEELRPFGTNNRLREWMRTEHKALVSLIKKFQLRRWQKLIGRVAEWERSNSTEDKKKGKKKGKKSTSTDGKKQFYVSKRPGEHMEALAKLQARARGTLVRKKVQRGEMIYAGHQDSRAYTCIDFSAADVGTIHRYSWCPVLTRYLNVMALSRDEVSDTAKKLYKQEYSAIKEIRQGVRENDGNGRSERTIRDSRVVNADGAASFPCSLLTYGSVSEGRYLSDKLDLLRDKLYSWNELMSASHWQQPSLHCLKRYLTSCVACRFARAQCSWTGTKVEH